MSHETVDRILREALEEIYGIACNADSRDERDAALDDVAEIAKAALAAPPRNCDLLANAQKALDAIHDDRCYVQNPVDERKLTVKWLFAEAKGECNEGKQQSEDA